MFIYYNANPFGRNVNDCSIRAISLATEETWDETYRRLAQYSRNQGITFSEVEFLNEYLAEQYGHFYPEGNIKTIKDFMNLGLKGRWLITMAGHITCVIDGDLYDTFDCSDRYIWTIYEVKKKDEY